MGWKFLNILFPASWGNTRYNPVPLELTYGLERLAMYIQDVNQFAILDWNGLKVSEGGKKYRDIFPQAEQEYSAFNFEGAKFQKATSTFF